MSDRFATPSLEVWAGIECTVNRVGDRYFDQLVRNGHHTRLRDLERIAELGIRTLRYPVLWERTAPDGRADWSWPDERLGELQRLAIDPIVGLLHHGSGPRFTSLVDEAFPKLLTEYARAVAERYPHVTRFTPVNEPLTTARFSGLYGHWYPHGRDDRTFVRALIHQCKATALAMQAIREVTPGAQLITTEDLGFTRSTPKLAYQAEFDNERRWISLDLLCGRVDRAHPLRGYLEGAGAQDLDWFLDHPSPPDVIGLNYYVTSERFLDENLARWPAWSHGGNGRDAYADVHAALGMPLAGIAALCAQAYDRYGLPLAITEAHMGCTREEQLRWIAEVFAGARAARESGIPLRAITAWSMLGAYDWHCLVTADVGRYEVGLFDVRSPVPRPTALARAWAKFARGEDYAHPVLASAGWWHRGAA
jgi:dTDP-4-dehydrorhamnose reductase